MNRKWEIGNSLMGNRKSEIPGTLELWNIGTLEHWNSGTLEPWNIGTLEPWNFLTCNS